MFQGVRSTDLVTTLDLMFSRF